MVAGAYSMGRVRKVPQRITSRFCARDSDGKEHTLYVFNEFTVEDRDRENPGAQFIQDANGGNLNRKAKGLYETVVGHQLLASDDPAAP